MTVTRSNKNNGRGFRILVADGWRHFIGPLKVQGSGQYLLFALSLLAVDSRGGRKLVRMCVYIYLRGVAVPRRIGFLVPCFYRSSFPDEKVDLGTQYGRGQRTAFGSFLWCEDESVGRVTILELRGMWRGRYAGRYADTKRKLTGGGRTKHLRAVLCRMGEHLFA